MTDTAPAVPQMDEAAARAAGVVTEHKVQQSYWGFDDREKFFFPDGFTYIEIKKMTEGDKSRYQSLTRSDISIKRATGDANLKSDPAAERHALLMSAVCGWNLLGPDGKPTTFNKDAGPISFKAWLDKADPKLVEGLEKAIRKFNPWLLQDMTVEDIDKEIANLQEMREEAVKREEGE